MCLIDYRNWALGVACRGSGASVGSGTRGREQVLRKNTAFPTPPLFLFCKETDDVNVSVAILDFSQIPYRLLLSVRGYLLLWVNRRDPWRRPIITRAPKPGPRTERII